MVCSVCTVGVEAAGYAGDGCGAWSVRVGCMWCVQCSAVGVRLKAKRASGADARRGYHTTEPCRSCTHSSQGLRTNRLPPRMQRGAVACALYLTGQWGVK